MLKLIIADDERIIRETISNLIDWESLDVALSGVCSNGIEAYDMIIDESPDIVLTDIKMPGMSGLELIKKAADMNLDTHFIILSGYGEFEYAKEAMKYGVKQYILKPCNEKQITESIQAVSHDCYTQKRQQVLHLFHELLQDGTSNIAQLDNFINSVNDMLFLKQLSNNLLFETKLRNRELEPLELTELLMAINQEESAPKILELLNQSIGKLIARPQSASNQFIEQIYSYVEQHLTETTITLKDIAENQLYMNVDYVSKRFQKETGKKFSAYLAEVRIRKAKQYLTEGYKIQEVAEKVGCGNNPHYFSLLFKKKTGMTPSSYISKLSHTASSSTDLRLSSNDSPFSSS